MKFVPSNNNVKFFIASSLLIILIIMINNAKIQENFTIITENNGNANKINKHNLLNFATNNLAAKELLLAQPNDLVYQYVSLPLDDDFGSDAIPLAVAALLTSGDILEIGMGSFSTPLIHNICARNQRNCISVENDKPWLEKFIEYNYTTFHKMYHLVNKNDLI